MCPSEATRDAASAKAVTTAGDLRKKLLNRKIGRTAGSVEYMGGVYDPRAQERMPLVTVDPMDHMERLPNDLPEAVKTYGRGGGECYCASCVLYGAIYRGVSIFQCGFYIYRL
jgi:hypothetical protein